MRKFLAIIISFIYFVTLSPGVSFALLNLEEDYESEINLIRGELRPIPINNLTRISIADPDIVDIADIEDENILIIAKDVGMTAVFIWEEERKRTVMVRVSTQDLESMRKRINYLLKLAEIDGVDVTINDKEGKLVLTGEYHREKQTIIDDIVIQFDQNIINLSREERVEDLIQVDMRIFEFSTSLSKNLGIDWITGEQTSADEDGVIRTTYQGTPFQPVYLERFPTLDGSASDYLKIGDFRRSLSSALVAQINALIEEGKGRILSEPKLVVKGGEQASFLVGGEIPITTTTTSDGATSEEVEYKEYGVGMTITPEVRNETQVDIQLDVEISDIDASAPSGDDVAFVTRTASTNLILEDGETNILAGLIRHQESENTRRIPFLSKIPVLGAMFRSKKMPTPTTDQEIVISMTPKILAYSKRKQRRMAKERAKIQKQNVVVEKGRQMGRRARPYYPGIPKEMMAYVNNVQKKISEGATYPQEAKNYGWQGTVKLDLLILNDGTLAFAIIKESSGHEIIDKYAIAAAKDRAPYERFPSETDLQELSVTIPIVYSLNSY